METLSPYHVESGHKQGNQIHAKFILKAVAKEHLRKDGEPMHGHL